MSKERLSSTISRRSSTNGTNDSARTLYIVVLLILVVGCGWLFYNYNQAKQELVLLSSPEAQQELNEQRANEVIEKVGRLMVLSTEEQPTVATIQDAEALSQDQPFFRDAQNGDKVLLYRDKAIIYNPTADMVVNVGPVFAQDAATETIAIDVRNGTGVAGEAGKLANELDTNEAYRVTSVGDAKNTEYKKTVVVNMGENDVDALVEELDAVLVGSMPEGEPATSADIVVIIGQT